MILNIQVFNLNGFQVLGQDETLPAYSPLVTNGASASRLEQTPALHGSEDE